MPCNQVACTTPLSVVALHQMEISPCMHKLSILIRADATTTYQTAYGMLTRMQLCLHAAHTTMCAVHPALCNAMHSAS
jgi:hypothetical protein